MINALKTRLYESRLFRKLVVGLFKRSPTLLKVLGMQPELFDQILEGAATNDAALVRVIDNSYVLSRIMRSPKVFQKLLEQVSANPESLYRMLDQRGVRKRLDAQNTFLEMLANQGTPLLTVLEKTPEKYRGLALATLLQQDPDLLRKLAENPEELAAEILALPQRIEMPDPQASDDPA